MPDIYESLVRMGPAVIEEMYSRIDASDSGLKWNHRRGSIVLIK